MTKITDVTKAKVTEKVIRVSREAHRVARIHAGAQEVPVSVFVTDLLLRLPKPQVKQAAHS